MQKRRREANRKLPISDEDSGREKTNFKANDNDNNNNEDDHEERTQFGKNETEEIVEKEILTTNERVLGPGRSLIRPQNAKAETKPFSSSLSKSFPLDDFSKGDDGNNSTENKSMTTFIEFFFVILFHEV